MNPGSFNLDVYRGDTHRWQFKLWKDVARTIPADITQSTVVATIRDKPIGGKYGAFMSITVTAPNIINMTLDANTSRSLPAVGVWDLQLSYASGDVFTALRGSVIVTQDVTHTDAPV